jgi:hypothetical protein
MGMRTAPAGTKEALARDLADHLAALERAETMAPKEAGPRQRGADPSWVDFSWARSSLENGARFASVSLPASARLRVLKKRDAQSHL